VAQSHKVLFAGCAPLIRELRLCDIRQASAPWLKGTCGRDSTGYLVAQCHKVVRRRAAQAREGWFREAIFLAKRPTV
jgi:hypothetical protein